MNSEKRLGNLYGCTGGNYAGNVYAVNALAPAIMTAQGGGQAAPYRGEEETWNL